MVQGHGIDVQSDVAYLVSGVTCEPLYLDQVDY